MSKKLRYASPVKGLSKINLLCKQKSNRIMCICYIIIMVMIRVKLLLFKIMFILVLGDCNMQASAACYIHTTGQGTVSNIFRIHVQSIGQK